MRTQILIVAAMLVIGVGYVVHAIAFRAGAPWRVAGPVEPPIGIAVVRTWGELLSQPAVELPTGLRVHVGVERSTIPHRSGALVYVLVEPFSSDGMWPGGVGPLSMALAPPGDRDVDRFLTQAADIVVERGELPPIEHHRLYVTAIAAPQTGESELVLWSESLGGARGLLVASRRLRFEGVDPAPWFTLEAPEADHLVAAGAPVDVQLANVGGPWAIPDHDGSVAMATAAPDAPGLRARRLPTLVPTAAAPELRLSSTPQGFTLESDREFVLTWPEDHLLARFFVNGQPVERVVEPELGEMARSGSTRVGHRLRVGFDWNHAVLGAQSGDTVSLEVLWCGAGWTQFAGLERMQMLDQFPRGPRRSNRITVAVP